MVGGRSWPPDRPPPRAFPAGWLTREAPALPATLRLLLLGGTTEATRLAHALAALPGVAAVLSLAGRTEAPLAQPLPTRIGGFGGVPGLVRLLRDEGFAALVDATHPFAIRISANAREAGALLGLPLAVYSRPPWTPQAGDRWTSVPNLSAAAAALGAEPRRVFLTTGRLGLAAFRSAGPHAYLIRTIDPPAPADLPSESRVLLARGPFSLDDETALMRREAIDVLVTKNSGGTAVAAKLAAARGLGVRVVLVEPPPRPEETIFYDCPAVLAWIARLHEAAP